MRESTRKFFELTDAPKRIAELIGMYIAAIDSDLRKIFVTPDGPLPPPAASALDSMCEIFKRRSGELLELAGTVHDRFFSDADTEELVRFYQTGVGQKLNRIGAEYSEGIQVASRDWCAEIQRTEGAAHWEEIFKPLSVAGFEEPATRHDVDSNGDCLDDCRECARAPIELETPQPPP